ncbi:hypothetical protein GJV85_00430 [Sulfurimonas aquatica]|uniref:Uncharacterized protein n=1 Tax=Sulfurimonas aquatica TaxID=2672570 RepID=A0A975AY60_9BACT|nr:hypothetical protein [Sulfurimonas aquatica]QSZ40645.1 hypothetical protein GJV85_00430 [Sulfurimonas aquatica]
MNNLNFKTTNDTIETDATSTNPLYTVGTLYETKSNFAYSSEISTTLIPQHADETLTINGVDQQQGVTEQRSMSVTAQIGYWYEGYYLNDSSLHLNFRAIAGMPIWDHTENTDSDTIFEGRGGYNADLVLSIGYTQLFGNELGVMLGYSKIIRNKMSSNSVTVPSGEITNTYLGAYLAF